MRHRVTIFYTTGPPWITVHDTHDHAYHWALRNAGRNHFVIDTLW